MKRLSYWIYPNNEIRIRTAPAVSNQRKEKRGFGHIVVPSLLDIKRDFATRFPGAVRERVSRDKPGYGGLATPTKFGLRAKRTILRVGGAVDKSGQQSSFLTGTLPGSTPDAIEAMARWSSYLVHDLRTWLGKRCRGDEGYGWFYVWEVQKRGALHLHMCLTTKNERLQHEIRRDFPEWWYVAITRISGLAGVDLAARHTGGTWADTPSVWQVDAQQTEKSVAAYVSKYCSKDSGKKVEEGDRHLPPPRWWGCSRGLLQRMRGMVKSVSSVYGISQAATVRARILAELSRVRVKGYTYSDRYGTGETDVIYVGSEHLETAQLLIEKEMENPQMSIHQAKLFERQDPVNMEYFNLIWQTNEKRVRFMDSIGEWDRLMIQRHLRVGDLERVDHEYIEQKAKEWWDVEMRISTNAVNEARAKSEASLAEQLKLSYAPPPDAKSGGMASAERDYLPPALRD